MLNTPTNYMNSKKRVIFMTSNGVFYATTNGKKTKNPKAVYIKNTGKKVANLGSVPSPIRPARVAKKPQTKGSKMLASSRKSVKQIYKTPNNMTREMVVSRVSPVMKNKPNLANAVERMKQRKANILSMKPSTQKY
jgi:hypothetical protein